MNNNNDNDNDSKQEPVTATYPVLLTLEELFHLHACLTLFKTGWDKNNNSGKHTEIRQLNSRLRTKIENAGHVSNMNAELEDLIAEDSARINAAVEDARRRHPSNQ